MNNSKSYEYIVEFDIGDRVKIKNTEKTGTIVDYDVDDNGCDEFKILIDNLDKEEWYFSDKLEKLPEFKISASGWLCVREKQEWLPICKLNETQVVEIQNHFRK